MTGRADGSVTCQVCGAELGAVTHAHLKSGNCKDYDGTEERFRGRHLNMAEYRELFGSTRGSLSPDVSGEKRPRKYTKKTKNIFERLEQFNAEEIDQAIADLKKQQRGLSSQIRKLEKIREIVTEDSAGDDDDEDHHSPRSPRPPPAAEQQQSRPVAVKPPGITAAERLDMVAIIDYLRQKSATTNKIARDVAIKFDVCVKMLHKLQDGGLVTTQGSEYLLTEKGRNTNTT